MNIEEPVESLTSNRGTEIKHLLSDIINEEINCIPVSRGGKIIFALNRNFESGLDFDNWRFRSIRENYELSYSEVWEKSRSNYYYLTTIKLHVYSQNENSNSTEYSDFVFLHCEPNTDLVAPHSVYKRSPHLHIRCALQPIPHSHLALNLSNLDQILQSKITLDEALKHSIKLIKEQILSL